MKLIVYLFAAKHHHLTTPIFFQQNNASGNTLKGNRSFKKGALVWLPLIGSLAQIFQASLDHPLSRFKNIAVLLGIDTGLFLQEVRHLLDILLAHLVHHAALGKENLIVELLHAQHLGFRPFAHHFVAFQLKTLEASEIKASFDEEVAFHDEQFV